jgi:hypothetical protein
MGAVKLTKSSLNLGLRLGARVEVEGLKTEVGSLKRQLAVIWEDRDILQQTLQSTKQDLSGTIEEFKVVAATIRAFLRAAQVQLDAALQAGKINPSEANPEAVRQPVAVTTTLPLSPTSSVVQFLYQELGELAPILDDAEEYLNEMSCESPKELSHAQDKRTSVSSSVQTKSSFREGEEFRSASELQGRTTISPTMYEHSDDYSGASPVRKTTQRTDKQNVPTTPSRAPFNIVQLPFFQRRGPPGSPSKQNRKPAA